MTLEFRIKHFMDQIDPELSHLPLEEFIDSVALTKGERKEAKELLKEQANG